MPPKPIYQSYWVVPNMLLAGETPSHINRNITNQRITALLNAGITHMIDLSNEQDQCLPYQDELESCLEKTAKSCHYQSFPLIDFQRPEDQQIKDILNAIDQAHFNNGIVYVHCWGGVGRTGTVVGCWLKRHFINGVVHLNNRKLVLKDLWAECPKSKYYHIPQSRGQKMLVAHWKLGE
jgi:protein tyrosine phosphatase